MLNVVEECEEIYIEIRSYLDRVISNDDYWCEKNNS